MDKKSSLIPKSKKENLIELINYQDDSIVSRTLLDKDKGTITLFSFDKDQGLSEHTAPFDAMIQVLDGEAKILISGDSFSLKSGEIIIMPANIPHAVKAIKKFKMLLTMIKS